MPAYHVSPSGISTNDGLSELNPKPTVWLAEFVPQPNDVIRLQAGAVFPIQIDWAWKNIGDPDRPILLDRYGRADLPNPIVVSPVDAPGFYYAGPGGIHVGAIRFAGRCFTGGVSGLALGSAVGSISAVRLNGTEVTGYTEAGIYLSGSSDLPARDVVLNEVRLWGNGKGTYLWGIDGLTITRGESFNNDWAWEPVPAGNVGQGWAVFASRRIFMDRCKALHNGRKTQHSGGPSGFFFQDCDDVVVTGCESVGNGDGTEQDGQGYVLVNCQDMLLDHNLSQDNLHGGFSLFNDQSVAHRPVRRCSIRHCWSVDDVVGLAIVGDVLDCDVLASHFRTHTRDGGYRKCIDVSLPGTRLVSVWGNEFNLNGEGAVLEAEPGLAGIANLRANVWNHPDGKHRVRGRDFDKIEDALAAEPVSL